MAIFVLYILKMITLLDPAKSEYTEEEANLPTFSQCDTFIDKVDINGLNESLQDNENETGDFQNSPPPSKKKDYKRSSSFANDRENLIHKRFAKRQEVLNKVKLAPEKEEDNSITIVAEQKQALQQYLSQAFKKHRAAKK